MKITLEDRAMTTPEEVIEKNIMRRIMKSGSAYTATIVPSMNFSIYAHRRVFPTSTCRKSSIASVQRCIHDHEPQDRSCPARIDQDVGTMNSDELTTTTARRATFVCAKKLAAKEVAFLKSLLPKTVKKVQP